ncbi:TPA: YadA-like family protein [Salmonella enterica subsp. enterica serovar Thompson]
MKVQHIKLVPTALLIVNTLNIGQAQAEDTLVCSTTGSGIEDFFCGPDSSTSGARRSIAIGDNVLIPKITVPGRAGIEQAIAIGSNVQGGGDNSITLGNDIITAGTGSVAIGGDDAAGIYNAGNKGYLLKTYGAKNNDSNISDFRANAALGNGTVSLGAGAQALADGAISIGAAATAGDGTQNGTGWSSTSGKQSIALGVESSALNHNAIALGYRANVTGYSGTAIGENASATSNNAIALGTNAMARDISDIAIGLNAIAQNSNGVTLASSLAIGSEAKAMTNNSFAIGSEAQALSPGAIAFGPSTTAGNNTGPAAGNNAIAIGFLANAPSQNSLAMGRGATTNGAPQSIALGYAAKTSAAEAIALGTNSAASGLNSIALGKEAKTTVTNSIAIGTGSLVSGLNSGAIGVPGTVSGSNAYSVGNNNTIMADNAFVVGNAVNNTVENSVVLGNGSTVSGATGTSVYTVNGVTHNFAGAVPVSTVSIGAAGKERTLTNVAAARISAGSTDAVNGSQLFAVTSEVDKGNQFAGNTGTFNRRLGEPTIISGGLATNATASNKNIRTIAKDGTIDIQLADNLDVTSVKAGNSVINNDGLHITDGPSVTSGGIDAGNNIIRNVADGANETDAVNKRQLDNLSTTVNRGWNLQVNSGDAESIAPGDTLNITEGDNIQISRTGKTLNIATARKVSFDNVTVGNISLDKDTGKIGGLSDGLLSTNSKDAVTGGQLFSTNENVTTNTRNIAANKVLLDSGLNFAGNTGSFNRRLGETTTIRGGLAADAAASNKNIRTEAKDGLLDIQLADNLDVTSVKTGNALLSNDGLHITGGPSVTEGGIDAGNRVISNVGDAVSDTDAVSKRQLDNLSSIVGQGLTFSANEGGDITRRPGDILALRGDATTKGEYNGKNIKTVTDISTGIISIKIAESPVFGNVVINDSNSGKITGVSDGSIVSGSKDVVNGGQIHHVTTAISNIIGGNAHISTDGSLITSNIGNTGKDTIHDAIDSVRNAAENASAGWNLSVNGQESSTVKPKDTVDLSNVDGNISITKKDNQVSFNLSDSVKVKESIGIKNGPVLTRSGVDGAGMKITNVADGTIAAGSSDAINGGQIHDFVNGEVTRPITFTADTGTPYDARLGTTLNVKGDNKNIQTMVSGNTLSVSLNENINVKSVKATDSLSVASGASIDMGGNAIKNVGNATRPGDAVNYGQFQQAFSSLGDQINRVERRSNAGAAAAIATAGLTQAYIPGKSMMSMSGGTFQGESSLAIGLSTISDNGNWVLKGSFSSTTRNQTGASVGVGFQF